MAKLKFVLSNGKRFGQSFEIYCRFIGQVIQGKKAIIHGTDYVVMSRILYEELTERQAGK